MALSQETTAGENQTSNPESEASNLVFPRKTKFRFNKDDTGFQRPAVEMDIPVPSLQGLIQIITHGAKADEKTEEGKKAKKTLDYAIEVLGDAIVKEVRTLVSDTPNLEVDKIDWSRYTFAAVANMPAGIRGASSIAKELWEKFTKEYIAIFAAMGVAQEVAATRVSVLVQKFRPLTGNPDRKTIITNLMATVAVYTDKTTQGDEVAPILEFLNKKAEELKSEDAVVTAGALGFGD